MNAVSFSDHFRKALRQLLEVHNFVDVAANLPGLSDIGAAGTIQAGGILRYATGGVADTEAGVKGTHSIHAVASNKPHSMSALINVAQAATDQLEMCVGFVNLASGVVSGGALAADFSGAGLMSLRGNTHWQSFVSNGATQRVTILDENGAVRRQPLLVGAGAQHIEVNIQPKTETLFDVTMEINSVPAMKYNDVDFTGLLAMHPYVSVSNASTTSETLDVWMLQQAFVR